jgi:hypothetical protein
MCVPGPGAYCEEGPRSWPGRAMVGSAIDDRNEAWLLEVVARWRGS